MSIHIFQHFVKNRKYVTVCTLTAHSRESTDICGMLNAEIVSKTGKEHLDEVKR